jgi:hypothetical protein
VIEKSEDFLSSSSSRLLEDEEVSMEIVMEELTKRELILFVEHLIWPELSSPSRLLVSRAVLTAAKGNAARPQAVLAAIPRVETHNKAGASVRVIGNTINP